MSNYKIWYMFSKILRTFIVQRYEYQTVFFRFTYYSETIMIGTMEITFTVLYIYIANLHIYVMKGHAKLRSKTEVHLIHFTSV